MGRFRGNGGFFATAAALASARVRPTDPLCRTRHAGVTGLCLAFALALLAGPARASDGPPNIVLILADDLGYGELGVYGNDFIDTPHLDALAAGGMRFTAAYAAAPVCSPSRAALLTGQAPARVGIVDFLRDWENRHLPDDIVTLPEALQQAGYATGHVGKWHLTGYRSAGAETESQPVDHGFDEQVLVESANISWGDYFAPYEFMPDVQPRLGEDEYLIDRVNLEALDFLRRHDGEQPFFLYKSHFAVHTIAKGRPDLVDKYLVRGHERGWTGPHLQLRANVAAQVELIDDGVGQIVSLLREQGRLDNTLILFTSDNGGQRTRPGAMDEEGPGDNGPFRGGKSQLFEGGLRVPLIAHMPGAVPAGVVRETPISFEDVMPTLLELAGAGMPDQPMDGRSIAPLLTSTDATLPPRDLFWHYPILKPHGLGGAAAGAVRSGPWKGIEDYTTANFMLFHLKNDPAERWNVARFHPEVAQEMMTKLRRWRDHVGVEAMPMTRPAR